MKFNDDLMLDKLFNKVINQDKIFKVRILAAVVHRKRIISLESNVKKSSPIQIKFGDKHKIFLHAEMAALISASKILTKKEMSRSTLYIVRACFDENGENPFRAFCKPCSICSTAIEYFGIQRIIHTHGNEHRISSLV